jgi:hypothetical protein
VGLLASAEKAAGEKDESKMFGYLMQIPSKAWGIGKVVAPQVLLHYLKLRGLAKRNYIADHSSSSTALSELKFQSSVTLSCPLSCKPMMYP